eukprot:scaffold126243_cov54-Phaeocystis_antarctica.AAC.2
MSITRSCTHRRDQRHVESAVSARHATSSLDRKRRRGCGITNKSVPKPPSRQWLGRARDDGGGEGREDGSKRAQR